MAGRPLSLAVNFRIHRINCDVQLNCSCHELDTHESYITVYCLVFPNYVKPGIASDSEH
jgi:hypothetical protein